MRLFLLGWNVVALVSMPIVWWSGCPNENVPVTRAASTLPKASRELSWIGKNVQAPRRSRSRTLSCSHAVGNRKRCGVVAATPSSRKCPQRPRRRRRHSARPAGAAYSAINIPRAARPPPPLKGGFFNPTPPGGFPCSLRPCRAPRPAFLVIFNGADHMTFEPPPPQT